MRSSTLARMPRPQLRARVNWGLRWGGAAIVLTSALLAAATADRRLRLSFATPSRVYTLFASRGEVGLQVLGGLVTAPGTRGLSYISDEGAPRWNWWFSARHERPIPSLSSYSLRRRSGCRSRSARRSRSPPAALD
jgi:hypothetical protein